MILLASAKPRLFGMNILKRDNSPNLLNNPYILPFFFFAYGIKSLQNRAALYDMMIEGHYWLEIGY